MSHCLRLLCWFFVIGLLIPCRTARAEIGPVNPPNLDDTLKSLGLSRSGIQSKDVLGRNLSPLRLDPSLPLQQRLALVDEALQSGFYSPTEVIASLAMSEPTEESYKTRLALAQEIIRRLPVGTPRHDIEKIFTYMDGGINDPQHERYYFGSEVMVEVPYDNTSGSSSPKNKVNGPITVSQSWLDID